MTRDGMTGMMIGMAFALWMCSDWISENVARWVLQ
jgi:hypothetical protein